MLNHVERGYGESVLLLPGFACTHSMYGAQLEALSDEYRAIAVDLRGSGDSPPLQCAPERVFETQAYDLAELLDELHIPRAHLVGTSTGGNVALRFALAHPDRVRSLTLVDTTVQTPAETPFEKVTRFADRVSLGFLRAPKPLLAGITQQRYGRWPAVSLQMAQFFQQADPETLVLLRRAALAEPPAPELAELQIPALVLAGDFSPPLISAGHRLAHLLPQASFASLGDAVDPSGLCQPAVFNRLLREFLDRAGRRG